MPQTATANDKERKTVRLLEGMMNEVDRIIEKFTFYGNRQQFIESAIREKIEKVRAFEAGIQDAKREHP
jgi:metal-responsive CopG/Arc/MetJ family transcriptional regulator